MRSQVGSEQLLGIVMLFNGGLGRLTTVEI